MFERSNTRHSIFRSPGPHTDDATVEPVGREQEIKQIADAVRPVVYRNGRGVVLICGKPGTGKTTCVKQVLRKLEGETSVKPVYINCWQYNTRPSLLNQLLIELGYPVPRKGKPVDELFLLVQEWIRKNRSIVVSLDEFDQLRDQTEVVYDLYQLNQESENNVGLLLLSNKPPSEIQLDPRSESRLNYRTITFSPYQKGELVDILEHYAGRIFHRDAVSNDVLSLIADHIVDRYRGDCRLAIETLHQAGQIADGEDRSTITPSHVETLVQSED